MLFDNEKQAEEFLVESVEADKHSRNQRITRIAIDRCMYEGCHWIMNSGNRFNASATTGRRLTNWNPDSNKLVATANRIPPLIRECAAATFPEKIEVDVSPPDRDMGIEAAENARVLEAVINSAVDATGYLAAANDANFRRCIDGAHGIGLRIKMGSRTMKRPGGVGTYEEQDQILTAFSFDATKLTLDPYNQARNLCDHEHVIYSDVWTADAIERYFGLKLDREELQTVGQLCQLQLQLNRLSENRLYANLPRYSKTKGATVHQIHVRDAAGRFSTMLIGVKLPKPNKAGQEIEWINFDNQETPFGGEYALPFTLLHGAARPDSMWSLSDAALMKDDQDRINLLATFAFRILQKSAGYQWIVAEEAMIGKDIDNFKAQFNNMVAGVIMHKGGTKDKPVPVPQMVQTPQPPPFIAEMVETYENAQRKMVHRADVTTGVTKSHVPNSVYQTALDQANQVLGNRIREDMRAHEALLGTMLGTAVKLAQEGSPSALAFMRRAGFDESDFAQVYQTDFRYPSCRIRIRESSIRYQSREEKEARLWKAVEL